jgi:cytochrome b6-f complex iron-sulfur subunit
MSSETLDEKGDSRRDFLGKTSLLITGVASLGAVATCLRLIKPNVRYEEPSQFKIGKAEQFPEGTVKNLVDKRVVIFSDSDGIYAISSICTHLGCTVAPVEWGFQCPCHGSKFALDGKVIAGPAPRPLEWHEIRQLEDGTLAVDTAKAVPIGTKYIFAENDKAKKQTVV